MVLDFANAALGVITDLRSDHVSDDVRRVTQDRIQMLWANIFRFSLYLGNNDHAFAAIIANPDKSVRGDCLHRFSKC